MPRRPLASEVLYEDKCAHTNACLHCRQLLIIGNTKWLKAEPGVKATHPRIPNPKGCWQTARAVGHLKICPEVTKELKDEGISEVIEARQEAKLERMKQVAYKPMALSNSAGGMVLGAGNLQRDLQQEARHAIARCPLNPSHPPPDSPVEDKHLRKMLHAGETHHVHITIGCLGGGGQRRCCKGNFFTLFFCPSLSPPSLPVSLSVRGRSRCRHSWGFQGNMSKDHHQSPREARNR
jgi:hypothetical protein